MNQVSEPYTIGIIGLGLMGGSLAFALRGFRSARLLGSDIDGQACHWAEASGAVHEATADAGSVIARADLLIFCVYAHHIPGLLKEHAKRLKPGCVVSDICGVKTPLYEKLMPLVPEGIDYVGTHPMAGKEQGGCENADPGLYRGCGFLITPTTRSSEAGTALMRDIARHIGAAQVEVVPPEKHDAVIAYTSNLMHIAATCLCVHPHPDTRPAFMAGAFRDCTRIADIDAEAWTELLIDNRTNTIASLDQYLEGLAAVRTALAGEDREALRAILLCAATNKRKMRPPTANEPSVLQHPMEMAKI